MRHALVTALAGIVVMFVSTLSTAGEAGGKDPVARTKPRIQIALLLDTSNSMDGLIDQAKSQLWRVVNEFASVRKGGRQPELMVALYEYGKSSLSAERGYIRQVLPFTNDLDGVSEQLFALRTNGGAEYCGMVIEAAVKELDWSPAPGDLKTIFIAGNEPFTQGPVDYPIACKAAVARGITVNTIHCAIGNSSESADWRKGALLADGGFSVIDQDQRAVHIAAPQDAALERLGVDLNRTYVPFGSLGASRSANQTAQDSNAKVAAPGAEVQRAVAKSSAFYKNSAWDLVDATEEGEVDVSKIKTEDLPKEMQKLDAAGRRAYLEDKARQRKQIQARIQQLNKEREAHVKAETSKAALSGVQTLDSAIIGTVRQQATKKGFVLAEQ